ncbi:hypothetical protein V8C42DRAFT_332751 [Trichoderma barbatum]
MCSLQKTNHHIPLFTTEPLMQELHGARGETFILDLSTSLKTSSTPLSAKKKPEFQQAALRIHTVREMEFGGGAHTRIADCRGIEKPVLLESRRKFAPPGRQCQSRASAT